MKKLLPLLAVVAVCSAQDWKTLPDVPAAERRTAPPASINDAAVYTINEPVYTPYAVDLIRKVRTDVLIRGFFKWDKAPDWSQYRQFTEQAHAMGMLFGGMVTCSALYDGENGLTAAEVSDMSTRDGAGKLVNGWNSPGVHHGTLSNPKYLEYIQRWGRQQIDNGVDYLFMDEINAALSRQEGYDDYSIRDFRRYLLSKYVQEQQWTPTDARWRDRFQVDPGDASMCPDGTMGSFNYRGYLEKRGFAADPLAGGNALAGEWRQFRQQRDDAAWKTINDGLREYARQKGRTLYLSGNGITKYVDLQVLGVWRLWEVKDGRVDLAKSQIAGWKEIVEQGHSAAGHKVPVVLFHDWGFGGFPWLKVPSSDRKLWMRVRGAEIYAAGGFFAFPILGPMGCDAGRDGIMPEIARQTAFYAAHRDLYLKARPVAINLGNHDEDAGLSTALWLRDSPAAVMVHVINRQTENGAPALRKSVKVMLPFDSP
jgi:hypothetical protein